MKLRVEALEGERTELLLELETIYKQVEELLSASRREREIAYQELRERNRELEQRLAELEKAHAKLQETQQMLIRSERLAAIGEMAAAIVHEINNPLSVIIGRAELLRLRKGAPSEDLEPLLRAGQYLRDLSNNVLEFARHHRGKACAVDLGALLARLEAFVRPVFRNVEIRLDFAEAIPQALADPGQLEQVLMNLLLNARDAVGDGGGIVLGTGRSSIREMIEHRTVTAQVHRLAIDLDEEAQEEDCVFAEVRDNGSGIIKENMGRLFETFFTTKGEEKGTGLGLSIARTILAEWGGNILVTSAEGHGSSFKVFLPIAPVKA